MWQEAEIPERLTPKQALIAAIAPEQSSLIRVNALNALRSLAVTGELQGPIWKNEEIQFALLQAVSIGQPADVRAQALQCMMQLSFHYGNARKMCRAGFRDTLEQAMDDKTLEPRENKACRFAWMRLNGAEMWDVDFWGAPPEIEDVTFKDGGEDGNQPMDPTARAESEAAQAASGAEGAELLGLQ